MTNRLTNLSASRAVLVLALAGGLWTLTAPDAALANPSGKCGTCGQPVGEGEGHDHKPTLEQTCNATDDANRRAKGDGDDEMGGTTTIRSGGPKKDVQPGQIAATAAAMGGVGASDDASAALAGFLNRDKERKAREEKQAFDDHMALVEQMAAQAGADKRAEMGDAAYDAARAKFPGGITPQERTALTPPPATAEGPKGTEDKSAEKADFLTRGKNALNDAGKAVMDAGKAVVDDLGTKAVIDTRYKGSNSGMTLVDDLTEGGKGKNPLIAAPPVRATAPPAIEGDGGNVKALDAMTNIASGEAEKERFRQSMEDANARPNLSPNPVPPATPPSPVLGPLAPSKLDTIAKDARAQQAADAQAKGPWTALPGVTPSEKADRIAQDIAYNQRMEADLAAKAAAAAAATPPPTVAASPAAPPSPDPKSGKGTLENAKSRAQALEDAINQ